MPISKSHGSNFLELRSESLSYSHFGGSVRIGDPKGF